jgi:SCY1-like protein 1
MKDPFTPCRLSALRAVIVCKEYFSQKDIAEQVLPCVIPHTLDGANDVRTEAFNVVDTFLVNLREESKRMAKDEADRLSAATCGIGANENSAAGASSVGEAPNSSGSGYLSGISSWMASSAEPTATASGQRTTSSSSNGMAAQTTAPQPGPAAPKFSSLTLSDAQAASSSRYNTAGDSGGWSDDDDIISPQNKSSSGGGGGWDDDDDMGLSPGNTKNNDDFFASFDSNKAKQGGGRVGSLGATRKTGGMQLKGKAKPAVKKLPASDLLDGWDDF